MIAAETDIRPTIYVLGNRSDINMPDAKVRLEAAGFAVAGTYFYSDEDYGYGWHDGIDETLDALIRDAIVVVRGPRWSLSRTGNTEWRIACQRRKPSCTLGSMLSTIEHPYIDGRETSAMEAVVTYVEGYLTEDEAQQYDRHLAHKARLEAEYGS